MRFLFQLSVISILLFSCQKEDPLPLEDDIEIFLSASVNNSELEIIDKNLIISRCSKYPDMELWQVDISGTTKDGKTISLHVKNYHQPGKYYTGTIGSRNWMFYSEKVGEEYGTIPVWWPGENNFIEEQVNNESDEIQIYEGNGYLEGTIKFVGYRSKNDHLEVSNGKFRIPFNNE